MRVLVVDDEEDVTLVMSEALRDRGYDVEVAASGEEAVHKADAFHPDAVLVDVNLPDIDGIQLAGLLRRAAGQRPLRVIAFTGYGQRRMATEIPAGLFDDFLFKPAALGDIERALARGA